MTDEGAAGVEIRTEGLGDPRRPPLPELELHGDHGVADQAGWIDALAEASDSLITIVRHGPARYSGEPVETGIQGQLKPGAIETRDIEAFRRRFGGGDYEAKWYVNTDGPLGKRREPRSSSFRIPGKPRNLAAEQSGIPPDDPMKALPPPLRQPDGDEDEMLKSYERRLKIEQMKIDLEALRASPRPSAEISGRDDAMKDRLDRMERMVEKLTDKLSEAKPAFNFEALVPLGACIAQIMAGMKEGRLTTADLMAMQAQLQGRQQESHDRLLEIMLSSRGNESDPLDRMDGMFNIFATLIDKFGGSGDSEKVAVLKAANDIMRDSLPKLIATSVESFSKRRDGEGGGKNRKKKEPAALEGPAADEEEEQRGPSEAEIAEVLEFITEDMKAGADPLRAASWLLGKYPLIHGMIQNIPDVAMFKANMKALQDSADAEPYKKAIAELQAELDTEDGALWAADFLDIVKGKEPPEEDDDGDEDTDETEAGA